MKNLFNFLLIILLTQPIISCTNTNKSSKNIPSPASVSEVPLKGCYLAILKRDTFQLAITAVSGENIEGGLLYNFYEKDRLKGTIKGKFVNGTLLADYTFQSEGQMSVRQVIFKKTADGFIEGYGSSKAVGGKEVFVDTAAIKYDNTVVYSRKDICLPY